MPAEKAFYSHGHHTSVTSHHALRTAANSAAFLLPHITSNARILDLGCGPGSITCDLAAHVSSVTSSSEPPNSSNGGSGSESGTVIGVDASGPVLDQGRALAEARGLTNVSFETGDANALRWEDGSFDVVYAHQVLQHVGDPVGVLREMKRVCKPTGVVAVREADYKSFAWWPEQKMEGEGGGGKVLERWMELYQRIARRNGGEPNAGRFLRQWAVQAGWEVGEVKLSWDTWLYDEEDARVWGSTWSQRTLHSGFAQTGLKHGLTDEKELKEISTAWKKWGDTDGRFIVIPNGEILCRRQ